MVEVRFALEQILVVVGAALSARFGMNCIGVVTETNDIDFGDHIKDDLLLEKSVRLLPSSRQELLLLLFYINDFKCSEDK